MQYGGPGSSLEDIAPSIPTGRSVILTPGDVSPVADKYEIYSPPSGGKILRLKRRLDFPVDRFVALTDIEHGHTWENRSALTSADENKTQLGGLYLRHGATATDWYSGTYTAPFRPRTLTLEIGRSARLFARISGNNQANYETCALMVEGPSNGQYVRVGLTWDAAIKINSIYATTAASAGITTGQRDAGIWVAIEIERLADDTYSWSTWYSVAAGATPPSISAMTKLQSRAGVAQWTTPVLRVGIVQATVNTNDTLENEVQFLDPAYDHIPGNTPWEESSLWAATQYDKDNTEQAFDAVDLGSDAPTVDEARLRKILKTLVNTLPGDAASWTFSCIQSTGSTPASNNYNDADNAEVEGAGRWFRLFVKGGSDGDKSGSFGPLNIPIQVA